MYIIYFDAWKWQKIYKNASITLVIPIFFPVKLKQSYVPVNQWQKDKDK